MNQMEARSAGAPATAPLLAMREITKRFPGVVALDAVTLEITPGEIHALVGENGAGKSTLMRVLSGVYPAGSFEGMIEFDGQPCSFGSINDSESLGIIIIHQELALVPLLSIAENLFLGHENAMGGVIDWPQTYSRSRELLQRVGLTESPTTRLDSLGVGKQQLIEIAKALAKQVRLLILDEPTASLQETDSEILLRMLAEFRTQGITSILISHKLNEIRQVADRITVLRDGAVVSSLDCHARNISEEHIIRDMVGRDMAHRYPARSVDIGQPLMQVIDWSVQDDEHQDRLRVHDANLFMREGEVVGIAGLMGAGRTELAMSLFGQAYGKHVAGEVRMRGLKVDTSTIDAAMAAGLAYVTEDRKELGLILDDSVVRNLTLANLVAVSQRGVLEDARELSVAEQFRQRLGIRTPSLFQPVVNLSGGNQQKVVLGKWLHTGPEVLILDEPTRGIDVGAKFEIYTLINELAAAGRGVLLISSEMPELLGICDRIYVMNEGELVGEMAAAEASQEAIMTCIMNHTRRALTSPEHSLA